jgi:hypothetical protein
MSKQPGLNLADLTAQTEDVPYGESFFSVSGVSAKDAVSIFKRFPKLVSLLGGFNLTTFIETAPDAVAAIIAAACGQLGNEAAEENASRLPMEAQFDILEAVGRLTFTNGFAPFVQRIMRLASAADSASFTKVQPLNSPPVSKNSSQPDTPQT